MVATIMSFSFESLRRRRRTLLFVVALLILSIISFASQQQSQDQKNYSKGSSSNGVHDVPKSKAQFSAVSLASQSHRRLLVADENQNGAANKVEPNRIRGDKCSTSDIAISQGPTEPLPSGIPTYTVEILNNCVTGCNISGIHFRCGWFASARLISPKVFKRLRFDDCLVNAGEPLIYGRTLSFQYANSFPYPLSVATVNC